MHIFRIIFYFISMSDGSSWYETDRTAASNSEQCGMRLFLNCEILQRWDNLRRFFTISLISLFSTITHQVEPKSWAWRICSETISRVRNGDPNVHRRLELSARSNNLVTEKFTKELSQLSELLKFFLSETPVVKAVILHSDRFPQRHTLPTNYQNFQRGIHNWQNRCHLEARLPWKVQMSLNAKV